MRGRAAYFSFAWRIRHNRARKNRARYPCDPSMRSRGRQLIKSDSTDNDDISRGAFRVIHTATTQPGDRNFAVNVN